MSPRAIPRAPLALVALLAWLIRRVRHTEPHWLDVRELQAQLDRGEPLLVLDVRGADEFVGPLGHIPVSVNIPLGDLATRMSELEPAKRRRVAIVCRTDKRSAKAAELLIEAKFADVAIVRGGMEQWQRDGFAVAGAIVP